MLIMYGKILAVKFFTGIPHFRDTEIQDFIKTKMAIFKTE